MLSPDPDPFSVLSEEYQSAFWPYFQVAYERMQAYAETLSPALRDALKTFGPRGTGPLPPRNLKPHSIWVAQFFGITDEEVIARAFLASLQMELHCCLQDRRIDGELRRGLSLAMSDALSNVLLTDSLREFENLAGHEDFHRYVRQAFCDLGEAYAAEQSGALANLSPEKMFKAVVDRAAPFHILVASLGLRSGRVSGIAPCSSMTCHLVMWFQILDDATDWEVDLSRGRRSYLLHRMQQFMEGQPFGEWKPTDVANALYLFGGAETLLGECVDQLGAALAIARKHAAPPAQADTPESLVHWLERFLEIHAGARRWSIARKWEFLKSVAV